MHSLNIGVYLEGELSVLTQQRRQSLASYDQHWHGQDSCMAIKLDHWTKAPTNCAFVAYTVSVIWAAMRAELYLSTSAVCYSQLHCPQTMQLLPQLLEIDLLQILYRLLAEFSAAALMACYIMCRP